MWDVTANACTVGVRNSWLINPLSTATSHGVPTYVSTAVANYINLMGGSGFRGIEFLSTLQETRK